MNAPPLPMGFTASISAAARGSSLVPMLATSVSTEESRWSAEGRASASPAMVA